MCYLGIPYNIINCMSYKSEMSVIKIQSSMISYPYNSINFLSYCYSKDTVTINYGGKLSSEKTFMTLQPPTKIFSIRRATLLCNQFNIP